MLQIRIAFRTGARVRILHRITHLLVVSDWVASLAYLDSFQHSGVAELSVHKLSLEHVRFTVVVALDTPDKVRVC